MPPHNRYPRWRIFRNGDGWSVWWIPDGSRPARDVHTGETLDDALAFIDYQKQKEPS